MFRVRTLHLSPMVSKTTRPTLPGEPQPWKACLRLRRLLLQGDPLEVSLGKNGPRDTTGRRLSPSWQRRTRQWTRTLWSRYDDSPDDSDVPRQQPRAKAANDLEPALREMQHHVPKDNPEDPLEDQIRDKFATKMAAAPGEESF